MRFLEASRIIGPGQVMSGSDMTLDEAIAVATKQFPGRSVCIVGKWFWIDLEAPKDVIEALAEQGKQPAMLLAFDVLFDTSGANRLGEWLRSTPLVQFTDGMFFQAEVTIYVLIGHGRRNTIPLSKVLRMF